MTSPNGAGAVKSFTQRLTNAWGQEATGIPPIQCPSWCTDPGHIAETGRADQNCYSDGTYVDASLAEVDINQYGVFGSRIGAMAYRGFGKYPVVLIHVEGFDNDLDAELRLTAAEAVRLANYLLTAADHVAQNNQEGAMRDETYPGSLSEGGWNGTVPSTK